LTRPIRAAASASTSRPVDEPLRAAHPGDDAQADLGEAELGAARRVDEVAGQRQLEAAPQREAVHRRDHRQARGLQQVAQAVRVVDQHLGAGRIGVGHRLDVGPRRERLVAGAGHDHAADGAVALDRHEGVVERVERLAVERVARLGAVHGEDREGAVARHRRAGWGRAVQLTGSVRIGPEACAGGG
jgi:hypothetical protein